ncbi:winged helix-turn-helix transcriptional regulator [Streptomyces sp. NBC_00160]|uniref:winged helix-turn-helix transcriptional regulator n=1 Tax=Streptomyces sp. NBC_00160 TaxID=2903628 RepID=UPI00225154D3|nr:winged helix-turn-helix transcriptional regulator [Streptomyces sp. NBC_00160]MCX5303133.1 winged helix-turn-helix transcriptional regulator [Streptomyces sp. NBC_00160]
MSTPHPTADAVSAAAMLCLRWTTRIISEIDDNGPIPHRAAQATFPDIPADSLQHGLRTLRQRGLLQIREHRDDDSPVGLTQAGRDLGDVYEALSRWARRHHYPTSQTDFLTRVEATLVLLRDRHTVSLLEAPSTMPYSYRARRALHAGLLSTGPDGRYELTEVGKELRQALAALTSWAAAHPQVVMAAASRRPGRPTTELHRLAGPALPPAHVGSSPALRFPR